MYNCTTSLKYFSLQNPHNNLAIVVVLNKKNIPNLQHTYFSK
jgi:hypothetical protein